MGLSLRCIQLLAVVYLVTSISYTSRRILEFLHDRTSRITASVFSSRTQGDPTTNNVNVSYYDSLESDIPDLLTSLVLSPPETVFHWNLSDSDTVILGSTTPDKTPYAHMLEETLLSKAFSQSLHPTRIIPYFYKAKTDVEQDDVTITTLVTSNRFSVLKQLVERYQGMFVFLGSQLSGHQRGYMRIVGPVSVTIHVPLPSTIPAGGFTISHPSAIALQQLHALYKSSLHFSAHVDVHLALSPFARNTQGNRATNHANSEGEGGRQFNVWRNVARLFARSDFVMMLDVDFAVCTDWRSAIRDSARAIHGTSVSKLKLGGNKTAATEVMQDFKDGSAALVIPAFEYVNQDAGNDQSTFPSDKEVRHHRPQYC